MSSEKTEKKILLTSFAAGLLFAIAEFIFAVYSHSQSSLMDAAYDAAELVFIVLILFLNPLFHKPISEKRPYGFFQVESIFIVIKGFMLLSVTVSMLGNVIESALSGGNNVDGAQVSIFQLILGFASIIIFITMKRLNKNLSSPTVNAELLGWRLDILYSLGMSAAFFISTFLSRTPLSFISPYFDQIVAVVIVIIMLPENIKMLKNAIKDVFLFSPDEETVGIIKAACSEVLEKNAFIPVFYDITRTGRHLWIAVYFSVEESSLPIEKLKQADSEVNEKLQAIFENCTCELILIPKEAEPA